MTHDREERPEFAVHGSGQYPEGIPDREHFVRVAGAVEDLGYDAIWSGDHLSFGNPVHEIVVASTFFAALTERVRIGLGVLLAPLRPPALVAKQIASLDWLSGGRAILGIGVGGESDADFRAVGVPRTGRGHRTDEVIDVVRQLWTGRSVTHHGAYYDLDDVGVAPPPTTPGGPPIWIGGRSETALRRVAARGDGWLAFMVSPDRFERGRAAVHGFAGRSPERRLSYGVMLPTLVDIDEERAHREATAHLSARYGRPFPRHALDRYCLVGSAETCRTKLTRYLDGGATHVVFMPVVSPARIIEQITRIRHEVVDAVVPRAPTGEMQ